ncbi:MAG: hypothetical protein P8X73_02630 [Ignavibacteriaceae bacterium]
MGRYIMILVLGAIITYSITNISLNQKTSQGTQNSVDYYSYNIAHNIANSIIDVILIRLANNVNYRITSPTTEQINGGYVTYTVQSDSLDGEDLIKIVASSKYNGVTKSITVHAKKPPSLEIDPNLMCITANSDVRITANFFVDARDHTTDGVLIPQQGSFALWSTKDIVTIGNIEAGGTFDSVDYTPQDPPNPAVIAKNQVWPGGFPTTIEELISNYPAWGQSLKDFAKTGINGSQYVTDPNYLIFPLRGVTYVDPPPEYIWSNKELSGNGFLIVHNESGDAALKNATGSFKGLIAADEIINLHSSVIGAIASLSAFPKVNNYVFGNSDGTVIYSKEAIRDALSKVMLLHFGFGKKRIDTKHWFE